MHLKPFLIVNLLLAALLSCNSESKPANDKTDSAAKKEPLVYPFTASASRDWQPGDESNAVIVLDCLKKYVDGDIAGSVACFADTAEFIADQFHFRGSRDSLKTIIANMRNASTSVAKHFESWITLFYPEKKETWVTLWYTEIMTDKKGKVDSIYYTDDVLVMDKKIVVYDEKQRRFPGSNAK